MEEPDDRSGIVPVSPRRPAVVGSPRSVTVAHIDLGLDETENPGITGLSATGRRPPPHSAPWPRYSCARRIPPSRLAAVAWRVDDQRRERRDDPGLQQPVPESTPTASSSGIAQHAAQATPARPVGLESSGRRVRSTILSIRGSYGDGGERDRAARLAGAGDQVVAAGVDALPGQRRHELVRLRDRPMLSTVRRAKRATRRRGSRR